MRESLWERDADLASEGAEAEAVEEAALADLAGVGDALPGAGLRPLVEEHHARAVDDVRLHAGDVQHLLNLRHPDHVVVGGPPYLHPQQKEAERASPSARSRRGWNGTGAFAACQSKEVSYPDPWIFPNASKERLAVAILDATNTKSNKRRRREREKCLWMKAAAVSL